MKTDEKCERRKRDEERHDYEKSVEDHVREDEQPVAHSDTHNERGCSQQTEWAGDQ